MLGLIGIIGVQVALICICSYWISWDMQHKDHRPVFIRQVYNDLVNLLAKYRGSIREPGTRSIAVNPVSVESANRRQSLEATVLPGKPVATASPTS
jgi:hypothetical protein